MKTPIELSFSKLNLLKLFIMICTTTVGTVSFGQAINAHTQTWLQFTGNYSDVDLGCNPANPSASLGTATATSACGGITITYSDGLVMSNGCNRYQKRTFTAKDACGHTATKSRTVRWTYDHTPPTININGGGSLNLGCNPSSININDVCGNVIADDNCCNPTLTSYDGPVVSQGCYRSQTRKWTAKDACGNTATASRTITWIYDHTPPTFTGSYADIDLGCNPANPSGSLGTASATDACGTVTITSSTGSVVSNGCNRSQKRTFTAKDGCGNIATKSRTIRWTSDQTAPTININGGGSLNLGCNPSSINLNDVCGNVTANDNCCDPTLTSSDGTVVSQGCYRSQTRTWTAKDACGNTATASRTVSWIVDHTPPSFTGSYTDVNLGCNPIEPAGSLGTATATDACGAVTITSSNGSVVSDGCSRSQKRTFTAKDGCGNTATTSRTVRWTSDVTPPSFTSSLADVDLGCNPANPQASLGTATATDACGAVTITSDDGLVISIGCSRSQKRTFTAKDACGNAVIASRTVRWTSDQTPPSFTGSYSDVNLGCNPTEPAGSLGTASATDACGGVTITSSDGSVVSEGCYRSLTRTFTAKDGCNNTATTSRTARWISDNHIPPSFTGSYADVNLGCNPTEPGSSLGSATATDACSTATITSSDGSVVSEGCNRSLTRTFTAKDGCNNTATTSRTVRWTSDVTPPSFTGNFGSYDDVILVCNAENAPGSLGSASATDACGPVTITSSDGSVVSDGCSRSLTRTFTAKDGCNNTATISRTVKWLSILSSPVISVNGQSLNGTLIIDLLCNPTDVQINATLGTANATNGCINTPTPTVTASDGPLVSDGCHRSLTRTFSASDGCGNTATAAIKLIWIANLIGPSINPVGANPLGTPIALGCNPSADGINAALGTVTATDACANITITSSDAPVVSDGCYRSKTRTFAATGSCGNTATASRTVTWTSDQTPPSFTGSYADVNLGCNPTEPAGSLGTATATDACGTVTITSADGSVISIGCSRSQKRTFTAKDGCGNTATTSRTVKWTFDHTAPTIIITGDCPSDLGCNPGNHHDGDDDDDRMNRTATNNPPSIFCNATATDACGTPTLTSNVGLVISNGCNRSQTKTWTAIDACGNTSTASRTVTWIEDHTPPVFTGNYADVDLGCNPENPEASLGSATATDACGTVTITSFTGPVIPLGCIRFQTRIFTAKDACGNIAIKSRKVIWVSDHTPPTIIITGGRSLDLGCNPSSVDLDDICGIVIAFDLCGKADLTSSDAPVVSDGCSRSQTRKWTATDECGNTSTTSRTVSWIVDHTPPSFTGSYTDVNLTCNAENAPGSLGTATATDACGAVTITSSTGSISSDGCFRSIKRTFTAKDACGNTATISRTVKWKAVLTSPILTIGGLAIPVSQEFDLGCNPTEVSINATLGTANATNGCATPTVTALDGPTTTSTSNACGRVRARTFTATDDCGHIVTAVRIVRWIVNNLGPQINTQSTAPTDLGCNPSANEIEGALGTVTATDACANITITSSDGSVVSEGCSRSKTRTFTATGACGNTATASRTVTWKSDVIPPVFTSSFPDVDLGCNPANPQASLGTATATDACGAVTITSDDGLVISIGCSRSQKRTFTAKDACGNAVIASRTVRWTSDVTPPSFTSSLDDIDLGCNPANPQASLGTATATDACGAVTITSDDGLVISIGCSRSQKRTFTAKDACGNAVIASRTVRWTSDVIPPVFTSSFPDVDLGCNPANPQASLGTATATDACGAVTITSDDGLVISIGCSRSQKRTFTAKDACGNAVIASRTVRWTSDVTPPSFTSSLDDIDLGCNPANPQASLGTATATDACGAVTITSDDGLVISIGCSRSQKRTFTAKDACGNAVIASRTVRWTSDVIPPVFTGSFPDVNLGCNPANPQASLGTATATDACGAVTITSDDGLVISIGCSRSQKRTFTAKDACGNAVIASRTVRWTFDVTPPSFTSSLDDIDLGCNPANPQASLGTATATDACGAVTITSDDGLVIIIGCSRSQKRTFTAKDACGNAVIASRTVRWTSDVTPPSFTGSYADVNLGCNPTEPAGSLGTATVTDACGTVTITSADGSVISIGCSRSQKRTFTAKDGCGNTATTSRTVKWTFDHTAPTIIITGGSSLDLGCNPYTINLNSVCGNVTANDACSTPTVTSSDGPVVSNGCDRSQTRTWTAKDACGNTSTASRTVRWTYDHTDPVFTSTPACLELDCNDGIPGIVAPTASDACCIPTVTLGECSDNFEGHKSTTGGGCIRIITRNWIAEDCCGNKATYTQTIRINCCKTGQTVCTLTQGAYGNAGGNICLPNGNTVNQTQIMITALTNEPGNQKVFGRQDLNRYWVIRLTDVNQGVNSNIFKMLPGGSSSKVFELDNVAGVPEYNNGPSWSIAPLQIGGSQNGKIRNQLFAQTLTLYFNTTITGSSLGNVSLDAGSLALIAPRHCGSSEPAGVAIPTQLVSPSISSYLSGHGYAVTVAGLLQLANDALGGVNISPLTLDKVHDAVNRINELFDDCRILTGYVPANSDDNDKIVKSKITTSEDSLVVSPFPNPYKENFSLKINSPVTGEALISFYTVNGVKVGEMKREVIANKEVWVPYRVPPAYRTRLVYTVSVGHYYARGIVLSPN